MQEILRQVCELQKAWSNANTPEMQKRGHLIRNTIPAWLESQAAGLAKAMARDEADVAVQGRDGTGRKTETPWVRFFSRSHAPTPRDGWYCVYLFHANGSGLYLALSHGSTIWTNGEFRPRDDAELDRLTGWARRVLQGEIEPSVGLTQKVDLGARHSYLGDSYAKSTAVARWYPADNIPSPTELRKHALAMSKLLGQLYDAVDLGRSELQSADLLAAQSSIEAIARPLSPIARQGGQGIGLNPAERKAVELRAMAVAKHHLERLGWELVDVSATKPFDYEARKDGKALIVEVKGSTGSAERILLTAPEVRAHRTAFPNNALVVVSMVALERHPTRPIASGGQLSLHTPWDLDDNKLDAIAYRYEL